MEFEKVDELIGQPIGVTLIVNVKTQLGCNTNSDIQGSIILHNKMGTKLPTFLLFQAFGLSMIYYD